MPKHSFSRRSFLKAATAGAAAGGSGIPAAAQESEPSLCGSVWERPPKQQGNNLNLIVIVSDTFRHDNLACYGPKWLDQLETPHLDRFASESVILKDVYPEGMPTIVIRRALYNEDVTLSETLNEAGYITALISDLYHEMKPTRNFNKGFHTWQWIRGQEVDYYGTSPHQRLDVSDMVSSDYLARFPHLHQFLSQYKANRNLWKQEGESL